MSSDMSLEPISDKSMNASAGLRVASTRSILRMACCVDVRCGSPASAAAAASEAGVREDEAAGISPALREAAASVNADGSPAAEASFERLGTIAGKALPVALIWSYGKRGRESA